MSSSKSRSSIDVAALQDIVAILNSYPPPVHGYNIRITDSHVFMDIIMCDNTVLQFTDMSYDNLHQMIVDISNKLLERKNKYIYIK